VKNTSAPTLLRIDSSARQTGSVSRQLADDIELAWLGAYPYGLVQRRDLAVDPLPHISEVTIQGYYTPFEQMTSGLREATALSDTLIGELKSAHTVLVSAPIYNFSLPSSLKAWIDQVVRIGHSFAYDGQSFSGLITQPRAVLALAYGAAGYQGPMKDMDHLRPYLTQLLGFLGLPRVDVVSVEATTADAPTVSAAVKTAQSAIAGLFQQVPA
jgi:FMN-dependent NADH-azoreductase